MTKRLDVKLIKKKIKGKWVWVLVLSVLILVLTLPYFHVSDSIQTFISNQSWTIK